jgi:hypothetical protein
MMGFIGPLDESLKDQSTAHLSTFFVALGHLVYGYVSISGWLTHHAYLLNVPFSIEQLHCATNITKLNDYMRYCML